MVEQVQYTITIIAKHGYVSMLGYYLVINKSKKLLCIEVHISRIL